MENNQADPQLYTQPNPNFLQIADEIPKKGFNHKTLIAFLILFIVGLLILLAYLFTQVQQLKQQNKVTKPKKVEEVIERTQNNNKEITYNAYHTDQAGPNPDYSTFVVSWTSQENDQVSVIPQFDGEYGKGVIVVRNGAVLTIYHSWDGGGKMYTKEPQVWEVKINQKPNKVYRIFDSQSNEYSYADRYETPPNGCIQYQLEPIAACDSGALFYFEAAPFFVTCKADYELVGNCDDIVSNLNIKETFSTK